MVVFRHNIFIKRIGFTLIRVNRQQTLSADQSQAEVLLQQLKWPIETMYVGMRMKDYNSSDVTLRRQNLDKWHTFSKVTDTTRTMQGMRCGQLSLKNSAFSIPQSVLNCVTGTATKNLRLTKDAAWAIGANVFDGINTGDVIVLSLTTTNTGDVSVATTQAVSAAVTLTLEVAQVVPDSDVSTKGYIQFKQLVQDVSSLTGIAGLATNDVGLLTATAAVYRVDSAEASGTVPVATQTINSITIQAHGIPIYNGFLSKFYNAYLPYHFGGPNVNAPSDKGALFIPFNLYPGTYQPSGHLNISRAREFYLSYTSSVIDTSNVGTLIVSAKAINFLLISDGSAVKILSAAKRQLLNNVNMHTYLDKQSKHIVSNEETYNCLVV